MKTPRLSLFLAAAALAIAPSVHAQASRTNVRALVPARVLVAVRNVVVSAPLNVTTTVVRPTPAGPVTTTIDNSFDRATGTGDFAIDTTLPNGNTTSVQGTITVAPTTGISVSGSITGPGGQSFDYTNTAVPSNNGIAVTSSFTPPSGNTVTHTTVIPPPPEEDEESDNFLARMIKRLRAPQQLFTPRD